MSAPDSVAVKIALDATPDPVTRIRIQVNGRQLDDFLPESGPKFEPGELEFKVPLAKGKNTVVVTALNEIGWSKVQDGTLSVTNESAGELDKRGTLYILAIGVSKYPGIANWCKPKATCDLSFTAGRGSRSPGRWRQRLGPLHDKGRSPRARQRGQRRGYADGRQYCRRAGHSAAPNRTTRWPCSLPATA